MAVTLARSPQSQFAFANFIAIVDSDTDALPPSVGFSVDLDGTLSFRPRENPDLIDMTVLAGVFYPVDIAQVDITGSTTVTAVSHYRLHL